MTNPTPSGGGHGKVLTIAECLNLSALKRAMVVAGGDSLDTRAVTWSTVIEWPVEKFVAQGEFVLTTGLGCDGAMLARLAREVGESGAAALCVSIGPSAPFKRVPASVRRIGEATGLPIIELPWEVRFADVARSIATVLLVTQFTEDLLDGGGLPVSFTNALLEPRSLDAIVRVVEGMTGQSAIVLDATMSIIAVGNQAKTAAFNIDAVVLCLAEAFRLKDPEKLFRSNDFDVVRITLSESLKLRAALMAPATVHGEAVAYLAILETSNSHWANVSPDTLRHGAVAVAIEVLRRRAAAEAESRVRGHILWELASSAQADGRELRAKAALLGYSLDERYVVMVAGAKSDVDGATEILDALVQHILRRERGQRLEVARRGSRVMVIVPQGQIVPRTLAASFNNEIQGGRLAWGIADGGYLLVELREGLDRASRAMEVGCALNGAQDIFEAADLASFMVLATLSDSDAALREANAVLAPLVNYDEKTSRALLDTLEVFLEANGNTTVAARRLYLNRHSLIYRLNRIGELTGRNLDRHEDRFLFDLSLRIHRLSEYRAKLDN